MSLLSGFLNKDELARLKSLKNLNSLNVVNIGDPFRFSKFSIGFPISIRCRWASRGSPGDYCYHAIALWVN